MTPPANSKAKEARAMKLCTVIAQVSGQNSPGQTARTKSPLTKSPLGQNPPGQNPQYILYFIDSSKSAKSVQPQLRHVRKTDPTDLFQSVH